MAQLFKIQDVQSGPGENGAMNRYWFDNPTSTNLSLLDVATAFADQHIEIIRFIQSQDWEHVVVLIENVLNGATALYNLIGYFGTRASESTPASNAWTFPIKPIGPTLKRGGKRIVGVGEGDSSNDVPTSGMNTLLDIASLAFFAPLNVNGVTVNQAIVRPVGTPPTSYLVSNAVSSLSRGIGTQVTRKLGRGGVTTSLNFVAHQQATSTAPTSFTGVVDPDDWAAHMNQILGHRPAADPNLAEKVYTL